MRSVYNQPGIYVIRVAGVLDVQWSERLGGLTITLSESAGDQDMPVSVLTGWLADQASLCGVINTLYDSRYPVLYVEYLGPTQQMLTEDSSEES